MRQEQLTADSFSPDTVDLLKALHEHGVRYLIVGGEAVIYYGYARVTGDIDFFYESSAENVRRLFDALRQFWGGDVPGVAEAGEFLQAGLIVQFGVPPNRIDLVNRIDGVAFAAAWPNRLAVTVTVPGFEIPVWFVGKDDLIANKRAAARPKDLDDLRFLTRETR
jgi:predicted nucleotidyltransferase